MNVTIRTTYLAVAIHYINNAIAPQFMGFVKEGQKSSTTPRQTTRDTG